MITFLHSRKTISLKPAVCKPLYSVFDFHSVISIYKVFRLQGYYILHTMSLIYIERERERGRERGRAREGEREREIRNTNLLG